MKILIATGIFPPDIGGPAHYAKCLYDELRNAGHDVSIAKYTIEKKLPIGIRHAVFFSKAFFNLLSKDYVIALDTWSVGVPSIIAAKLLGKKSVVRIGGDFLWEWYLERTSNLVTLQHFNEHPPKLSTKEIFIKKVMKMVIPRADRIVFSTVWQRDIFTPSYGIINGKTTVIENFFPVQEEGIIPSKKNFLWAVRPIKFKNGRMLYRAFAEAKKINPDIILDDGRYSHDVLMEKVRSCYAIILPSLTEVSPNLILDALRYGKPFILTKYGGYSERLKAVGIFVDPLDENDIVQGILKLSEQETYEKTKAAVNNFVYTHSYQDIAKEYLRIINQL